MTDSLREQLAREMYEAMIARPRAAFYAEFRITPPPPELLAWEGQPEALRDDWRAVADVVLRRFPVAELAYVAGRLEGLTRTANHATTETILRELTHVSTLLSAILEHAGALRFDPERPA